MCRALSVVASFYDISHPDVFVHLRNATAELASSIPQADILLSNVVRLAGGNSTPMFTASVRSVCSVIAALHFCCDTDVHLLQLQPSAISVAVQCLYETILI